MIDDAVEDDAALRALVEAASELARTDPDAARARVDAVLDAARGRPAPVAGSVAVAAATYLKARLLVTEGQPVQALDLIVEARDRYQALGLTADALRTQLGRMHVLDDLGRHGEAQAVGMGLLAAIPAETGDGALLELRAAALGNIGVALGFRSEHDRALDAYRGAAAAWQRLGHAEEVTVAVANQGIELLALGRAAAALDLLSRAVADFESFGDVLSQAKTLGHRGRALATMGRFMQALDDCAKARELFAGADTGTESWRLALESAATLLALGMDDEALVVLAEVEPKLTEAGLTHDLATCSWLRGVAELRLGQLEDAREQLSRAADLFHQVADPAGVVKALVDLSRGFSDARAMGSLERASLAVATPMAPEAEIELERRRAELAPDVETARGHLDRAQALAAGLQWSGPGDALLQDWAALRYRQGDVDGCVEAAEQSARQIQAVGSGLHVVSQRSAYLAGAGRASELAIRALLDRGAPHDVARAALLADSLKAHTLIDVIRGGLPLSWPGSDPQTVEQRADLDDAYSMLFVADRNGQRALWQRIERLEGEIAARHALQPGHPAERSRPVAAQADPVAAAEVSIAYHVLGTEVLAFVSIPEQPTVVRRVSDRTTVLRLLDDLESHLGGHAAGSRGQELDGRVRACRRILQLLHDQVMAPVEALLPGPTDRVEPLLIVPHGPLHRVPFQALHDGQEYLVARRLITMAPSLSVSAAAARQTRRDGRAVLIGFADATTARIDDEVAAIARITGPDTTVLRGGQATGAAVRDALDGAAVVHFACHGLFRPENPAFSCLQVSDAWLRAADLAGSDLRGATAVLSACETGRVGGREGHEAVGLAHGFLAAGTRHVVVSQWLVDDVAAQEGMTELHTRLVAGIDPPVALREVQLAMLNRRPHPYHWAPFVVVGAPSVTGAAR